MVGKEYFSVVFLLKKGCVGGTLPGYHGRAISFLMLCPAPLSESWGDVASGTRDSANSVGPLRSGRAGRIAGNRIDTQQIKQKDQQMAVGHPVTADGG